MKRDPHGRCKKTFRFICENLDEKLDSARCRSVRKHLDTCKNCRIYLHHLKKTIELYRRYPIPKLSTESHKQLLKILKI